MVVLCYTRYVRFADSIDSVYEGIVASLLFRAVFTTRERPLIERSVYAMIVSYKHINPKSWLSLKCNVFV